MVWAIISVLSKSILRSGLSVKCLDTSVSCLFGDLRKHDVTGLSKEEKLALDSLREDKSIIVSKPDKGQGVAILNKCDYIAKMESILQDQTIFKPVKSDDNISKLSKFQGFLYRLKASKQLDDEIYHLIRPTAASTPMLYGLPKLH